MKLAVALIAAAVLALAVGGAFVLRGGEYAMFLLALALVCFFGSLPVMLGVLTRRGTGGGGQPQRDGAEEIVIASNEGKADESNLPI